jgi:hypothetical protein
MAEDPEPFLELVAEILRRFCAQNQRPVPSRIAARGYASRLWTLVEERGLPRPLTAAEQGSPGELAEADCAALLARVCENAPADEAKSLAAPLRQLLKACFHAEFKTCRDSFREVSADGICRRQQLTRVRERVSGSHCIDCPYWVSLSSEQHWRFLQREWQEAACDELIAHRAVFLPEDFRALRLWLYARARVRI